MAWTATLWSAAIGLVCVGQWLLLRGTPLLVALSVWVAGLGLFVWLQWPTVGAATAPTVEDGRRRLTWWRWALVGGVVVTGLTIWVRARGRPEQADWTDITVLWAVGVVVLVIAAWPARDGRHDRVGRRRRVAGMEWALVGAVVAVAIAARFIALGRFPIAEGDGMSLSLLGRQFTDGELSDPFSTAFFGSSTLYPFMQSTVMKVFGESLVSARLLSAAVGSLTVLATYGWCRRLLGVKVALIASAVLAVLPIHLYFSRISVNLVEDALFLVLVLWLLDRALVDGRRIDAVLTGVALGPEPVLLLGCPAAARARRRTAGLLHRLVASSGGFVERRVPAGGRCRRLDRGDGRPCVPAPRRPLRRPAGGPDQPLQPGGVLRSRLRRRPRDDRRRARPR